MYFFRAEESLRSIIFEGKKITAPSFYNAKTLPAQPSLTGVHTPGNVEAEDVSFAFLPR